jgi:hypothetical protein
MSKLSNGQESIVTNMRSLIIFLSFLFANPSWAGDILQSSLYKTRAKDCTTVNLETWHHPTKYIFEKFKINLEKVELCNNKVYPIFSFSSQYDPRLRATNSFFLKLYSNLATANGWWSFAMVDTLDDLVIFIDLDKSAKEIKESIEEF